LSRSTEETTRKLSRAILLGSFRNAWQMRKLVIILIFSPMPLLAQWNFTPFVGLNSTRLSESYGYAKGGNFGIYGIEIERTFVLKAYSPVSISLMTGLSYLPNGFNQETSFSFF